MMILCIQAQAFVTDGMRESNSGLIDDIEFMIINDTVLCLFQHAITGTSSIGKVLFSLYSVSAPTSVELLVPVYTTFLRLPTQKIRTIFTFPVHHVGVRVN